MKAIIVDLARCNGCHNCQIACKDEHCGADWSPVAKAQPQTGQFWCKVNEKERGRVPVVRVDYTPTFCGHCDNCPLIEMAPDAVYRREDGMVVIDPEKAQGRKDLVDACPLHMVFWNAELELPQKCTGCAHLLDDGWKEPRCVDACGTDALRFGDVEEFADEIAAAETAVELDGLGSHVYYLNTPKRFVAGTVADRSVNEVVIGAAVELVAEDGTVEQRVETDEFGDFRFEGCGEKAYQVKILLEGRDPIAFEADCANADVVLDDILVDQLD